MKIKNILSIALTLLVTVACTDKDSTRTWLEEKTYCPEGLTDKKSDFILQCLKNANPKSDEEPEDWIMKCEDMAENLYCKTATYRVTGRCGNDAFKCYYSWNIVSSELVKVNDE